MNDDLRMAFANKVHEQKGDSLIKLPNGSQGPAAPEAAVQDRQMSLA